MAEAPPPPGRGRGGRGAIIAKLLQMDRTPGPPPAHQAPPALPPESVEDPVQFQSVQEPVQPPRVGGRGAALNRISQQLQQQEVVRQEPVPTSRPAGRGQRYLALAQKQEEAQRQVAPDQTAPDSETQPLGVDTKSKSVTQPSEVDRLSERFSRNMRINPLEPAVVMRGTSGHEIDATANYISLYMKEGRGIYEYEVKFNPPVDDRSICEKMLFLQHKDVLNYRGFRQTFDGVTLYIPFKLSDEACNLQSTHTVTNETHMISLIFRRERSMLECTHMYNVLFNNIQKELNLVQLKNKEYFSQKLAIAIPKHKLEVWPGYVTSVQAFEGGIQLNCNCSTKVLRTQTVLDLIYNLTEISGRDWKEKLQKELIGQSVMTRQPVRMYRVDDIDFSKNPTSTFLYRENVTMDYISYHKTRGIEIKDKKQPLLIHRPKPSKRPGANSSGMIHLIPELCYLTGLTDEMRSDFKVMKDVAMYTRVNPNERVRALQKFINDIRGTPSCVQILDQWGLEIADATVKLKARVLQPEVIYFGKNATDNGSTQADWGRSATSREMLSVVNINSWLIIHTQNNHRQAEDFINMMGKVCPPMGVHVEYPVVKRIPDDKTETYLRSIKEAITSDTELIVIIFPTSRDDRYAAIKKFCCVDRPIPSQVINSRTIGRPDKMRSIVQKIALQINCKLGGALWSVRIPFKNAMICGFDSYHDTKNRAQSVCAFISSLNPQVTRWYSQVFIQSSDRELLDGMRIAMCTALIKYREVNGSHPDTIIVFRDGVGDGQLKVCQEHEIKVIHDAFKTISPEYNPSLAFIVCQKRINTRIFIPDRQSFQNPNPGTIVDHTITRRQYYDFFLVSQLVRQGTVTPTHYIVLHNSTKLDPDKIQKITYKMCHLYYNWPGTVRVPAPCQYAHKLAFLVGNSLHKAPSQVLCDKLFFL